LIGEKYLNPLHYADGRQIGDNECATDGFNIDSCRGAGPNLEPLWDTASVVQNYNFGSAHPEGFHMVFCDGSVHLIDYRIDPYVDGNLANRADGQAISSNSIY
jgi:prepilin-type processing-associated H-X9-DG protein